MTQTPDRLSAGRWRSSFGDTTDRDTPWLAQTFVAVGLLALALIFLTQFPITHRSILVQVEEILLLLYTSLRSAMCLHRARPQFVRLLVFLWTYSLFGLVQIAQLSANDNPFHIAAPDSVVVRQLALMLIGLLAMDIAATLGNRGNATSPGVGRRQVSLTRVVRLSWVMVIAAPVILPRLGGLSLLFENRNAVGSFLGVYNGTSSLFTLILAEVADVVPWMCVYALLRLRKGQVFTFGSRPDLAVLLVLLIAVNVVFNNPITQARFWVATMVISVALAGRWIIRPGFQIALVAGYLFASVLAFPYLDATRNSTLSEANPFAQGSISSLYVNKLDYATIQDVNDTIQYVDDQGHTDGRQVLGAVFFFVPRSIWPSKADNTAKLLAINTGYRNTQNLDSPLWAEGYIDGGWFGAVILLGAFGFAVGRADRAYRGLPSPLNVAATVVPVFAGYELLILRGSLLQAMGRLFLIIAVGLLISERCPQRDDADDPALDEQAPDTA